MPTDASTLLLAALIGLIFGSFVTALSYRLPRGIGISTGRSKCMSCGTTLGPTDLVPVLSWVVSRGRCRSCGASVSARYPAIELITMAACVSAALVAPVGPLLFVLMMLAPSLVASAAVATEHGRVPVSLGVASAVLIGAWAWMASPSWGGALGMVAALGVLMFASRINILRQCHVAPAAALAIWLVAIAFSRAPGAGTP